MTRDVHVTVAAVVERDGQFLLVEERIAGATVLNQPAGHWEAGETLVEAVLRETLEEAAWEIEVSALIGVYDYVPPDLPYSFLRFAYAGHARRHRPDLPLDAGIERAMWLSRDELAARKASHRSPMVMRCVDDFIAGHRLPLGRVAHL